MAKPLFKLLQKQVEYEWREEQQKSFEDLKVAMTTAPVLAYPDPRKPYTLETDASGQGLGAVLAQPGEVEGKLQPVAYISRVLQAAEKNYGVTEQECLAVIWGLKQFRHYLLGQPFTVITDHQSLKWLMKQQSPNGRLARWALAIQEYEFEIVYRPGAVNYTADALSRAPLAALVDYEPTVVSLDEFRKAQREDPVLGPVVTFLEEAKLPSDPDEAIKVRRFAVGVEMRNKVLVIQRPATRRQGDGQQPRLVVPKALTQTIIRAHHDDHLASHPGAAKLKDQLALRYFWKGMPEEIAQYTATCLACQRRKPRNISMEPPLKSITAEYPFALVGIDVQELPLTNNNHKYLLVIVDYFTKWVEAFPIAKLFVADFICRHGVPRAVLSDQGPNLTKGVMAEVYAAYGIHKKETTPYTPSTNGQVENVNRQLQERLAMLVASHQRDWDDQLPFALFALRTAVQQTTGESAYYAMYGQDPYLPIDRALQIHESPYMEIADYPYAEQLQLRLSNAWTRMVDKAARAQQAQARQHDKSVTKVELKKGDQVLVADSRRQGRAQKLGPRFSVPHTITAVFGSTFAVVPTGIPNAVARRLHQRNLKPYKDRDAVPNVPDASEEEEGPAVAVMGGPPTGKETVPAAAWGEADDGGDEPVQASDPEETEEWIVPDAGEAEGWDEADADDDPAI
jgi:hypothetical protein